MANFLAPIINEQQENSNGAPLSGGTIEVYLAGSSTPATTYSDQAGANPNTWPIVLNTLGVNNQGPVWLVGGFAYKFVIKDSTGVVQRTIDNVTGINDNTSTNDQWIPFTTPPTYVSATSFTVAGDQRQVFQIGRRVKTTNTGGTIYSTITGVAYVAPNTTVTVRNDSGILDSGLSAVSYGVISPLQTSFPGGTINYGQCRLSVSGGNVILQPYNGNRITINGSICLIPAAGVTLAPTALTPGTSYFIYAYMEAASGALTLEASTTAHATDATTGVEIKSGDATRTLVGMGRPIVGPAWANTDTQRLVISWFNRRGLRIYRQAVGAPGTGSLTPVGIIAAVEMLCWGDSPIPAGFSGAVANNTVNQICLTALGFDSPAAFSHGATTYQAYAVNAQGAAVGGSTFLAAEGFHSVLTLGQVTGGVGTWQAGFEMSGVIQG